MLNQADTENCPADSENCGEYRRKLRQLPNRDYKFDVENGDLRRLLTGKKRKVEAQAALLPDLYHVEEIAGDRMVGGKRKYLTKWAGWGLQMTEEPATAFSATTAPVLETYRGQMADPNRYVSQERQQLELETLEWQLWTAVSHAVDPEESTIPLSGKCFKIFFGSCAVGTKENDGDWAGYSIVTGEDLKRLFPAGIPTHKLRKLSDTDSETVYIYREIRALYVRQKLRKIGPAVRQLLDMAVMKNEREHIISKN